jgi:hypothetical protein
MSFLLRLTSSSATGREIVRTRAVAGDTVTIGRDPSSDIHLTDLEVTHRHARIRQTAGRLVVIEATANLPLLVDGRSTMRAELDAARGGEITIGATRIGISVGEEAGVIALAVTTTDTAPPSDEDAARRFSLVGTAPGKRPMAWLLALIVFGVFLIWPIWSFTHQPPKLTDQQMASGSYTHIQGSWSAGPLSLAHAPLQHDCKACHVGAFVAVPDSACKSCHAVHDHADLKRLAMAKPQPTGIAGLKQRIAMTFGHDPGRCVDCHLEHLGAVPVPKLSGASCTDCHAALKSRLTDTRLADAGNFASSHPQFAPLVMTKPGDRPDFTRVSLDTAAMQDDGLKFTHAQHMSRTNGVARMWQSLGHAPMQCQSCHVADNSGARFQPVSMEKNCQECHSLAFDNVGGTIRRLRHGEPDQVIADIRDFYAAHPGGGSYVATSRMRPGAAGVPGYLGATGGGGGANAAIRAVFSKGGACYDCHVVVQPTNGSLNFGVVPVKQTMRYLQHGWFDHSAHSTSTCQSCHGEALTSNDVHKVMVPGIKTCRTCHGGPDAKAPMVKSGCEMCHDYHRGDGAPQSLRIRGGSSVPGGSGTVTNTAGGGHDTKLADRGPDPIRPDLQWRGDADRTDLGHASGVRTR